MLIIARKVIFKTIVKRKHDIWNSWEQRYFENYDDVTKVHPVFHDRSKHIEMKYHFIRDMVQKGAIKLQCVRTEEQIADILTKPLSYGKFVHFPNKLGVIENVSFADREC